MMMSGRNKFPFTATQWQELEHQALIYKYMASGIPIPPDLLFTIKRSCMAMDSPLSSKFFPRQTPHVGWSCFQMGLERKIDPEPGRCRRTDGKKWRCSKEAYPDSKYCERHMHRGKNRSRKPVEVATQTNASTTTNHPSSLTTTTISPITKTPSNILTSSSHSLSLLSSENLHHHQNYLQYPPTYRALGHQFLSSHTSSSRPHGIGLSSQDNNNNNSTQFLFDSGGSCSLTNTDYRNRDVYGIKEAVGEHAFFSETSGSMRSLSGSSLDDAWQFTPLTMSSSSPTSKQRTSTSLQSEYSHLQLQSLNDHTSPKQQRQYQHSYLLGNEVKCIAPMKSEKEEEPQKIVHRFFDEWPPKNKDSWLDLDEKSSNSASVSTTRLSISIPSSSHDFPIFNLRAHNDG